MLRYELKYFVHNSKENILREMIAPFVRLDKHAEKQENHEYTVRSIYFDTPKYRNYFEKVEGIKNRKKLRIRGYNELNNGSDPIFFEIKRKYEIPILKNRALTNYQNTLDIFKGFSEIDYHSLLDKFQNNQDDAQRFFFQYALNKMEPVVLIVYEREAYQGIHDDTIRITFDKNLRSKSFPKIDELYTKERLCHVMTNSFILEIKFNDYFPSWMKPIIGVLNLKRESASKYVMGIDATNMIKSKGLPKTFLRKAY
ncbi:MAG: VTC domain-containing protein [Hyphomicrobiales bacterium]